MVTVGEIVTLDGSASTDDVGIVSHVWDFDDSDGLQQDATSAVVQHSYGVAGTYAATLTVTDVEGEIDSDTVLVIVQEIPSETVHGNLDIVHGTATIDGDLSEWQSTTDITIYAASERSPEEDNTAIIKSMYDDTYLYFAYDVTDTNLQADRVNGETGLHLDDSIEVYIDTLHNNGTAMQTDDYHFIVNLNGAVVDYVGTGSGKDHSYTGNIFKNVSLQGSKNDASDTDTGYIIEIAIPWSDIGGKTSNNIVGLLLAINDLDNSGDVYSFNWCNLTGSYAVPESWGNANIVYNNAPVLNSIDAKSVEEGSTLSFTVSASDADDGTLAYSATDLPSGASIDSSTGAFSWAPVVGQAGTHSVTFEVTDGQFTDSEEVIITVNGNLDPTPSMVYDNRLREASPDSVHSDYYYIDIGHKPNGRFRDVMWFDLSEYNTTDTISNATLSLHWYYPANSPRNQDTVVEIYRAADWNSDNVSWINKAAGTPWNNAGGDWFDANNVAQGSEPYASITFDANDLPDNKYYEFDITELVQDYVSGEYDNTGFFLKARDENNNYIAFYSSEWTNPDQRPKLTIDYATEIDSAIGPENPSITPVHLSASSDQIAPGETFTVDVLIDSAVPIIGAQFDLLFDQNGASTFFSSGMLLNNNGKIEDVYCSIIGPGSVTSQSWMATISMAAGGVTG